MARYVVERTFPEGVQIPANAEGRKATSGVIERNAEKGVTWVLSYVADDNRKTYCIYDGPSPEAIREAAACNEQPVDRISKVSVLDPYFHF